MSQTAADEVIFLAGLVAAIAATVGWIPAIRLLQAQRAFASEPIRKRVAIAAQLFWVTADAGVVAAALCVLVAAGVLGFGWLAWTLFLPFGLLAGSVLIAVWARINSRSAG